MTDKKIPPCSKHAYECPECDGTGKVIISCCGVNITHQVKTTGNDLCPECKEHCGDEPEICECQTFNVTD